MNIKAKLVLVRVHKTLVVKRLDIDGKWPSKTWLQQRRAMIKLEEAKQEFDEN